MIRQVEKQVMISIEMIEQIYNIGKDELYKEENDGHYFWQELYHALMGSHFWFRLKKEPFQASHDESLYVPELEEATKRHLTKDEFELFLKN